MTNLKAWTDERIKEAARMGYEVRFKFDFGILTATYWNGEYRLYDREFVS